MEKDYFGPGGYINGLGFRVRGERPVTNDFSKGLLLDLDEEIEGEYDEYGRRKKKVTELKNLDISEVSFVDRPATRKTFYVVKGENKNEGDENKMMEELKGWEDVSEKELSVIRETISILSKYDLVNDLKRAEETLTKYFGEGTEVKKYDDKVEWSSVQRCVFGYDEDDLSMISDEDIYEVEKSYNEDTKWPSLSGRLNRNKKVLERIWEERNIEARAI